MSTDIISSRSPGRNLLQSPQSCSNVESPYVGPRQPSRCELMLRTSQFAGQLDTAQGVQGPERTAELACLVALRSWASAHMCMSLWCEKNRGVVEPQSIPCSHTRSMPNMFRISGLGSKSFLHEPSSPQPRTLDILELQIRMVHFTTQTSFSSILASMSRTREWYHNYVQLMI